MKIDALSPTTRSAEQHALPEIMMERGDSLVALHYAVNAELANRRIGSAATKGRSAVTGSNVKPWRQKGTGRARAGSRKSPIWRGGGVVFGPQPRDYHIRVPRKQRAVALCSAFYHKASQKRLFVIGAPSIAESKTKLLSALLASYLRVLEVGPKEYRTVLLITDQDGEAGETIRRAGANIPYLTIQHYSRLSLHTLFYSDYAWIYAGALEKLAAPLNSVFQKRAVAA